MVRVNVSDATVSFSEEGLRDSVFGAQGDLVNLKSQFAACSHNKLQFIDQPLPQVNQASQVSPGPLPQASPVPLP